MALRSSLQTTAVIPARQEGELLVGLTHVTVTIRNPGDLTRKWQGVFLVDTGAIDCMVPANHLHHIGIRPRGVRDYQLADGTEVNYEIGVAEVEFFETIVGATVVFGGDDVEPILGVTALESAGIVVDPRTQELKRLPALPLK